MTPSETRTKLRALTKALRALRQLGIPATSEIHRETDRTVAQLMKEVFGERR